MCRHMCNHIYTHNDNSDSNDNKLRIVLRMKEPHEIELVYYKELRMVSSK